MMINTIIDSHWQFDVYVVIFSAVAGASNMHAMHKLMGKYYFILYLKKYFLQDWFWGRIFKGCFLKNVNFIVSHLLTRSVINSLLRDILWCEPLILVNFSTSTRFWQLLATSQVLKAPTLPKLQTNTTTNKIKV